MTKFLVKAFAVESYEEEIEAETQEQAEEIFEKYYEECEIDSKDNYLLYPDTEEFEIIQTTVFETNNFEEDNDSE